MLQKFICVAIAAAKKRTTGIRFVTSIGSSHPVSEIATSHVYRLKKTRNEGDLKSRVFQSRKWGHSAIYSECRVVEWLQWGRRSWNIPRIGPSYLILWYMIQLPVDWLSFFLSFMLFYFRSIFISYQHRYNLNDFYNFRACNFTII